MYSQVMTITPEIAAEMLKKNHANNRPIILSSIKSYTDMMKSGKWKLTSQGISIDEDGTLVDGQNRLHAIIRAGCPVQMYVSYDVPRDSFAVMDTGAKRNPRHALHMKGYDTKVEEVGAVSYMIRREFYTVRPKYEDMILDFFDTNAQTMRDVYSISGIGQGKHGKKYLKNAPNLAALWCAYINGVPLTVLNEFCNVVNSGFYGGENQTSAIVLRKFYDSIANIKKTKDNNETLFCMTQEAIKCFLKGESRRMIWKDPKPVYYYGLPLAIIIGLK